MTQKITVAKLGVSGTATDPNDLIYSSDFNTLKYYTSGTQQVIGTAGTDIFTTYVFDGTVAHNLGYYPYFTVYCNDVNISSTKYYPFTLIETVSITSFSTCRVGTANLYFLFAMNNSTGSPVVGTATFVYKIFRNDLGLS